MNWFKEWRNPALKCERLGHVMVEQKYRVYKEPEHFMDRHVAEDHEMTRQDCSRCSHTDEDSKEFKGVGGYITSLTMSNTAWDIMRERGYVIYRTIKE